MSAWTHALCIACWNAREPTRPATDPPEAELARSRGEIPDTPCCACGELTYAVIYVREDPAALKCAGAGSVHA